MQLKQNPEVLLWVPQEAITNSIKMNEHPIVTASLLTNGQPASALPNDQPAFLNPNAKPASPSPTYQPLILIDNTDATDESKTLGWNSSDIDINTREEGRNVMSGDDVTVLF